jgi:Ca-activated chloride channel family protein
MIWSHTLGALEYYLGSAFLISCLFYFARIFIISGKTRSAALGNILKKFILRSAYLTLIFIALLGPSFGDIKKELRSVGKDIFLVIDISSSMNAYDVLPSRLEKVKKELRYMIRNLRFNDRIGIIVFSDEAKVQCPLTYDLEVVNMFLETISTDLLPERGTQIGPALQLAEHKFLLTNDNKDQNNKLVILAGDGEDFDNRADNITRQMQKNGILLFTLGVGTDKGSKIPDHPGFKKGTNGSYIITRLDKKYLSELASNTGGNYFEINNELTQTEDLLDQINKLEGTVKEVKKMDISSNKYYYFLAAAIFLIVIDGLITMDIIKI